MWPQITIIVLSLISIGLALGKHGQPRKWNFWYTLCDALIMYWLLWAGGFFDPLFK